MRPSDVYSDFKAALSAGVNVSDLRSASLWQGVAGEFVATTLFLMSVMASTQNPNLYLVVYGLAIAVLVQVFGGVSGGHLNNAVSFGLLLVGRVSFIRCMLYTIAQVLGAITGVAIVKGGLPDGAIWEGHYGVCSLAEGVSRGYGMFLEAIMVALLVTCVLSLTDPSKPAAHTNLSLSIGLTVMFALMILVPITGCGINPARVTGSAVVAGDLADLWVYWLAGYLGATAAVVLYLLLFSEGGERKPEHEEINME